MIAAISEIAKKFTLKRGSGRSNIYSLFIRRMVNLGCQQERWRWPRERSGDDARE